MTRRTFHFPARELQPYAEPVNVSSLQVGQIYVALNFLDDGLLLPVLEPVVFIGQDLEPGERALYFQDAESYRQGIRHDSASADGQAVFTRGAEPKHIFDFESALNQLMLCSLRRNEEGH